MRSDYCSKVRCVSEGEKPSRVFNALTKVNGEPRALREKTR